MLHPNDPPTTPEWSLPVRVLPDGCDGCDRSELYCHAVRYIEGRACCEGCDHAAPGPLLWEGDQA